VLADCVHAAVGRSDPELVAGLGALYAELTRRVEEEGDPLFSLLHVVQAGRSGSTWHWSRLPRGERAAAYFDGIFARVSLPEVATRHPAALVALLRVAADLGLDDWLRAHGPRLLGTLPTAARGLLRPCDLAHLRTALPLDMYDVERASMERIWHDD